MKIEAGFASVPPPPSLVVPPNERALADPGTLRAYRTLLRRTWGGALVWAAACTALLLTAKIAENPLDGAAAFFLMPTAMFGYLPVAKMSRLAAVKRALAACPWEPCSVVRVPDAKVGRATAVQLGLGDDGRVTPVFAARQPRRRKRLPEKFYDGAWFAGHPERGGVLALPGPRELTLVYIPRR